MQERINKRRQPWPYAAKEARDRSAEDAHVIVTALKPILDGQPLTDEHSIRAVARAALAAMEIRARLAQQGAPVEFM